MKIWLILLIVLLPLIGRQRKSGERKPDRPLGPAVKRSAPTAVPNKPRSASRSREEEAIRIRTRSSRESCHYEAAYSKGRPDQVGRQGDFDLVTPEGMERIKCGYCGAQNFIPAGSREHYHCYFCWEKL
ncbi:MAG: hypothetical protein Q4C82_01025 [Eubacteriales bacterium]|nr:hypothetical protein [Eubacteriales bacterium]